MNSIVVGVTAANLASKDADYEALHAKWLYEYTRANALEHQLRTCLCGVVPGATRGVGTKDDT
jgi:hypothetical protein